MTVDRERALVTGVHSGIPPGQAMAAGADDGAASARDEEATRA